MDTQDPVVAWHFARPDRRLGYSDGREIKRGSVFRLPSGFEPRLCEQGFHGSICPVDALIYAPGFVVSRTEHRGIVVRGGDKLVSSVREHIVVVGATNTVVAFADWCAKRAKSHAADAAYHARYAARAVRGAADAAYHARYAAHAAGAAAAERKLQNEKLTEMLCELIQREGFQ